MVTLIIKLGGVCMKTSSQSPITSSGLANVWMAFQEKTMMLRIEPPATHAGKATTSKVAPFSDKLMMYNTNLLASFGLGSNALGGGFSLRSDLPAKMALNAKDIFTFAQDGGKIMIKKGRMEEPPQIEDRNQLTK